MCRVFDNMTIVIYGIKLGIGEKIKHNDKRHLKQLNFKQIFKPRKK